MMNPRTVRGPRAARRAAAVLALLLAAAAGCSRFVTPRPRDAQATADGPRADTARDSARRDQRQTTPDRTLPDCARLDGARLDGAKPDSTKPDAARLDAARLDGAKPDGAKPDVAVDLGTYSFDFSGPLSGWTTTSGSFTVKNGQLVADKSGDNDIETSISFDRSQGTIRAKGALPSLDCRGANLSLFDGVTEVLLMALDYCGPAYGGSGGKVVFQLWGAAHDVPWAAPDTSMHTLEVSFAGGLYTLRLDGAILSTATGPARLKATKLRLGGWIANYPPGTPFDDVYLGP